VKFSIITATYDQLPILQQIVEPAWLNQSFQEFEWVLAVDGDDGTYDWAKRQGYKAVRNRKNKNYDWSLYNKAAKVAEGEYLVWVMGDSYPDVEFLEKMNKFVSSNRVLNGIRYNVDERGTLIKKDWRLKTLEEGVEAVGVSWKHMTLNSMCMPRLMFHAIGGFYTGYKGYGRTDYDLTIRAAKNKAEFWCLPKAIIYHLNHGDRQDTEENIKLFDERNKGYENSL
jgi:GT2 family glycosyltransferase